MNRDIQFEKGVCDLEHKYVGVTVVVDDEDTLYCATHAKIFIVVLETLETCGDGGVLFWLSFFCAG
jgi:hypothetical protein